jgi:DNA topoisomerase III
VDALTQPALTGEWEHKLRMMERGQMSRDAFMQEIRKLTSEIVEKVKGHQGVEIQGNFKPLDVACPKCGAASVDETFRSYKCGACGLTIWKTIASRELERDEVAKLLTEGKVGPLEGFRNKFGRTFSATVKLDREEWKTAFDFQKEEGAESDVPPVWVNPEPVGKCRCCADGQVFEAENAYICDQVPAKKCTFRMGKTILKRAVPRTEVAMLLQDGKTHLISGFVSARTGRSFKAFLVLKEDGKVGFEFAPRAEKPAKGKTKTEPAG